jgi:uncharacterized membrane protein YhiD involved in acid resistance
MKAHLFELLGSGLGALSIQDIFLNFLIAVLLSVVIFVSYRLSHAGAVYSASFNITLVKITLVTTLVMNVIGNNIALSLGMVGALSIIRYRTAIKDPRDSAYIFWCIAVGICCGVQEYLIAAIGSGFIFLFMMIFGAVKSNNRLLLIVRGGGNTEETVKGTVEKVFGKKARLCVVNAAEDSTEFIYELSRRDVETAEKKEGNHITSIMMKLEGVKTVSLVDQNDEINQ